MPRPLTGMANGGEVYKMERRPRMRPDNGNRRPFHRLGPRGKHNAVASNFTPMAIILAVIAIMNTSIISQLLLNIVVVAFSIILKDDEIRLFIEIIWVFVHIIRV